MNSTNSLTDLAVQQYMETHGCSPELAYACSVDFEHEGYTIQPEPVDAHVEAYAEHCLNTPVTVNSDTAPC